ncbi:unnamed protein product [Camellia sinensis]
MCKHVQSSRLFKGSDLVITSPLLRYNPYVQARSRINQLKRLGHSVDKVEFILMGG